MALNNSNIWFIIGAIVLISTVAGSAAYFNNPTGQAVAQLKLPPSQCADTDGGRVYTVQGTVYDSTRNTYKNTDNCINSNDLIEYYCNANQPAKETYKCPNGCSNGACLLPPQPLPTPPPVPTNVNANSCKADAACEMGIATANSAEIGSYTTPSGSGPFPTFQVLPRTASAPSQVMIYGPTLFPESDVRVSKALHVGGIVLDGKTVSTKPGSTSNLILTSDTKGVIVDDTLSAPYIYTNTIMNKNGALGMGIDNNGNIRFGANGRVDFGSNGIASGGVLPAAFSIINTQQSPNSVIEVNTKAAFRDDVEFVTAYADNFKARNHVSADILTVRSAQAPVNQPAGVDNAYACFDKYGNLFRSNTPCR